MKADFHITQAVELFLIQVSRSACLKQVHDDKCYCFACEASRLLAEAEALPQEESGPVPLKKTV